MPDRLLHGQIVALRNEKGSYNAPELLALGIPIVALRNEKGSYNCHVKSRRKG